MAKKYIYADSAYSLTNPPKGVTVLEFDTETNTIGIYNNKKAAAAIPVQPETDNDNSFTVPVIPTKLSELQNDKQFVVSADLEGKYALKSQLQSFLSDISYNSEDKVLSFTFKLSDGTESIQTISISDLVDTYQAGDGIVIEGNTISFNGNIPNVSEFITIKDVNTTLNDYALKSDIPESVDANFVEAALKSYTKNYTTFQVMPNKTKIAAGTTDDTTGLTYTYEVPACTEHKFTLRSANPVLNNDVIIDWGDGVIQAIKDGKYEWTGKGYEVSHNYADTMTADSQKFIVKIYGKDYYTFRSEKYQNNNLICRIFDVDLSIAAHVTNFASMCYGATRLLKVNIPHSTSYVTNAFNFSSAFQYCSNVLSIMGFEDSPLRDNCIVSNMFKYCLALIETDFVIPTCVKSIDSLFYDCRKLTTKIDSIIPATGFALDNIKFNLAFGNTYALTGTVPANVLWNSNKTFIKTETSFRKSGINSQVPDTWCDIR